LNLYCQCDLLSILQNKYAPLIVLLLERLHVLGNVATDNVTLKSLGVNSLGLGVVSGETLGVVGDKDTTIRSTLQGTKHTVTSGGTTETDIEVSLERAGLVIADCWSV
jgi:hypothetical protein